MPGRMLQSVCLATLEEIRRIPGLEKVDRLHICEMVQRRGGYKNVGYDKIFSWIEQVLVCAKQNDVMYVNVPLPRKFFEIMPDDHLGPVLEAIGRTCTIPLKKSLPTIRLKAPDGAGGALPGGYLTMSPYVYCFWYLLVALDRLLAEDLNAYGMMILDEQNRNEKILENLHFYRYLRSANLMDRVIDYPVFRTNKQNLTTARNRARNSALLRVTCCLVC